MLCLAMDKARLQTTLEMAERHVLEGERHIARQKELIAEISVLGADVSRHRATLAAFEETQRLHTEHMKQLKQELINAHASADDQLAPEEGRAEID